MVDIATLGLEVKSSSVVTATGRMDRMTGASRRAERASYGMARGYKAAGLALKVGLVAGLLGATLALRKFISASIEQQRVITQLEAALRSTGGASGFTSGQLQDMAAGLQKVTTFGDETVIGAQALLLTFTRIGRDAFPAALEATLNVATAMGTDLKSAAIQVGKALNDPIVGMTALSRSGITFSESQRETIKMLVDTGKAAEAQKIILNELETQFGGSARAARQTLGGALSALGNAFGDLFEVAGPGTDDLRMKIEELVTLVSAESTRAAFQAFGQWIIDTFATVIAWAMKGYEIIQKIIDGVNWVRNHDIFGNYTGAGDIADDLGGVKGRLEALRSQLISGAQNDLSAYSGGFGLFKEATLALEPFSVSLSVANDNVIALNDNTMTLAGGLDGLRNGFDQAKTAAHEIAETIGGAFKDAFSGIGSEIMKVLRSTENWGAKTGAILDVVVDRFGRLGDKLIDMALDQAISALLSNLIAALGGGASLGGYTGGNSISGALTSLVFPSANGNVFSGAGIGAYSNSIVSSPTVFPFASGIGLMGEAGPEAIMPLRRGPSGRLGVEVANRNKPVSANSNSRTEIVLSLGPELRAEFAQIAEGSAIRVQQSYRRNGLAADVRRINRNPNRR